VRLLEGRPSTGVLAGMAVLVIAGATVAVSALAYHGRAGHGGGTGSGSPGASSHPGSGTAGAGGGQAAVSPPGASASASALSAQSPSAGSTASPSATTAVGSHSPSANPPPACGTGDLALSTSTDQPTYQIGNAVRITTTMRNASGHTCTTDGQTGCGPSFTVFDSGGATVWTSEAPGTVRSCPAAFASPLTAGQSVSFSTTWNQCTWQNQKCTGQVQRGAYSAAGDWSEGTAATARFSIA